MTAIKSCLFFVILSFLIGLSFAEPQGGECPWISFNSIETPSQAPSVPDILKEKARSVSDWKEYAEQRYGDRGGQVYDELGRLGKSFVPLLVDIGIVQRLEQFVEFVGTTGQTDGWKARKAFSDYLGSITVFRGMALSEDRFLGVMRNGIQSSSIRENDGIMSSAVDAMARYHFWRLPEEKKPDDLISVSDYCEVSIVVARMFRGGENVPVYLFRIEVPRLEITYFTVEPNLLYSEANLTSLNARGYTRFSVGDRFVEDYFSERMESFVELVMAPSQITGWAMIDEAVLDNALMGHPKPPGK